MRALLVKEVARLDDEMRRLACAIAIMSKQLETMKGKLQDQILLFEGGLKQAASAKQRSQEKQVEENVLKLKIDQFEKSIKHQNNKIYNMQRFKLDIDCVRNTFSSLKQFSFICLISFYRRCKRSKF